METFLPTFMPSDLVSVSNQALIASALHSFHLFIMVVIRISGLMTIGPLFGQSLVPANVRILLVLTISLIVTPTLFTQAQIGFDRLDVNQNQYLSRDEIPPDFLSRYDVLLEQYQRAPEQGLQFNEYHLGLKLSSTLYDFLWKGVGEFSLGLSLGLGVMIILSGLQMVGEMVDQQIGISLGEVFNPGLNSSTSINGQLFFMLGSTIFVLLTPINGHVKMLGTLIETFQSMPAGEALLGKSTIFLLRDLVHQSLALAIQVALPLLAATSLLSLTMGYLGHSVPQVNVLMIGFAVRSAVNLVVLLFCLSSGGETIVELLPQVIDRLGESLHGYYEQI
ncbi:MAG: flagellar biosynthetic protein FliR [Planctomycetaceae bacterium]